LKLIQAINEIVDFKITFGFTFHILEQVMLVPFLPDGSLVEAE
jgi:hypothetical protein